MNDSAVLGKKSYLESSDECACCYSAIRTGINKASREVDRFQGTAVQLHIHNAARVHITCLVECTKHLTQPILQVFIKLVLGFRISNLI